MQRKYTAPTVLTALALASSLMADTGGRPIEPTIETQPTRQTSSQTGREYSAQKEAIHTGAFVTLLGIIAYAISPNKEQRPSNPIK